MPEFKINKIAYTWKGNWTADTFYKRDDVVKFGGKSYVSVRTHTAQADFYDDLYYVIPGDTSQSPAWVKMTDGYAWRGDWTTATKYNLGDIISYSGSVYICTTDFTSSTFFDTDLANLVEFISGQNWTQDWEVGTRYGVGDLVKYNGMVYRCITGHTSAGVDTGLEVDQDKWETLYEGIEYRGVWDTAVRYRLNDLVRYGGSIFRCNTGHTSGDNITNSYWDVELPGFIFGGTWTTDAYYAIGDLVLHGGYLYYSRTNNTGKAPGDLDVGPANWKVVSKGTNFRGTWESEDAEGDKVYYKTGDVVRRGGQLYIATMDSSADGSSLDYLDAGFWEVMIPGDEWRNYWITGSTYAVGDVVIFDGSNYRCSYAHIADDQNFPGDNGSGYVYWDLILQAGPNTGLRTRGDLLSFDLTRTLQGDGSSFGVTAVEIGDIKEILTIDSDDSLYYKSFNELSRGRYVAPNGTDDPARGDSPFKPWKTLRYACEQVLADDFSGHTNIILAAGVYEEILPIIVPKRTALVGILGHGDLRAVTVKPNKPITALAGDAEYTLSVLSRMRELIPSILQGIEVVATETNHVPQVIPTAFSDASTGLYVQNLIADIQDYINFYLNSQGEEPAITSTNLSTTDTNKLLAVDILESNKDFLKREAVAFMEFFYPTYNFDPALCQRDVEAYIDAWKYDLTYEGNYRSVYAARYYRNAVLGSETEDMFYVRDASGVRNMTLSGLNGTLNPANVYGIFKRPTGGSFVSLDPGWGPEDESTWIMTRSCYVQNVTTFGYASVGQKIDGALHGGGNKSIVSNDFTQVISDGVGAWVLNGGRAELVSVFTYYAQVGYLAEDGGKIRATNGNNSYGFVGALAVGNDPTETPRFGTINNRNNDAVIAAAFAGEVNDEILIFEFEQAGQNYTTATYNIIGSGTDAAVVQEEFRDNAIHYPKLINPQDSSIPGGSGYVVAGNNAQGGDLTSISIANSDENEEANYKGLRIIITSGTGTGQYGIVDTYNTLTKVITVLRESDGQPGWDHVISGYPLANPITSSATYRIEPRPIFSAPPFETSLVGLPVSTQWNAITYGETTETFTNVQGTAGEGITIEVPYTVAAWNVTKVGRSYTVVLGSSTGAGYEAGQTVILSGDDVGGVTPDNDITITINTISNDSTNSILTFSYSGIGASGKFVITPATGTSAIASPNGTDWVDSTLPSDRNWKSVAAGLNRFVAVSYGSNAAASSNNGTTWTARTMPASRQWNAVAFGVDRFVAVSGNLNSAAYSTNGTTWTAATMPTVGDSTINEWVDITYGLGRFVAVANSNNVIAVSEDGISWAGYLMDTIDDSSQRDWVSIAYGNNRFVAMSSQGDVSYSFDSTTWYPATMPSPDGSTRMNWKKMKYAQGVFFALCDTGAAEIGGDVTTGPTRYAATSPDGIQWTGRTLNNELSWGNLAFGNPDISLDDSTLIQTGNNTGTWIMIADSATTTSIANRVYTGATAKGRVIVASGRAGGVKLWDPGSGYTTTPELTIFDPNASTDAYWDCRVADGVLAQPSWLNRGLGYKTSSTRITVSGDGFADIIPANRYLTLSNLERYPGPGAQLRIDGNDELYTAVVITPLTDVDAPGLSAYFQVSPNFDVSNGPLHGTAVEIRERYSQCRITGHDFLDIGSGNFEETNYPALYSTGLYFSAPENEIVEFDGGRVFYTSTDQSGNFRAGELFAVEQATGIVTISADYFDLQGLSELSLGGVRLGGSGAVVREFSTDALFTEDSNNIVPTQRAIKSYLANRLSVGGADIATASFIAGVVKVGPDAISNTINQAVIIPVRADFEGPNVEIFGTIMAQQMFFKSFKDR